MVKKEKMTSRTGSKQGTRDKGQGTGVFHEFHALHPTSHGPTRGLTLIEILISVIILASASVLMMQALAKGAYTLTVAKNRISAYAFAASKMADLELALEQGAELDPRGQFRIGRDAFQWRVEQAPFDEGPNLERVTLTVEWHQGRHDYASQVNTLRHLERPPSK